ncbi:MAG: hypothetical protein QXT05_03060 [Candidatus Bilamarchaeaceae archaeon]
MDSIIKIIMVVLALVVLALLGLFSGVLTLPGQQEKGGAVIIGQSEQAFTGSLVRNRTITADGKPIGELVQLPGQCGYVYVQCGVECKPCEEECKKECVETGSFCGYGPEYTTPTITQTTQTTTRTVGAPSNVSTNGSSTLYIQRRPAHLVGARYYGDCCDGDICVNGRCVPEDHTCIQQNNLCGYGPTELQPVTRLQRPTYYGECCEPYKCINGYCQPYEEEECAETGERCALPGQPSGIACCEGLVCNANGVCVPPTQDYCTDSDGGINYNVSGTVRARYGGVEQSGTDYCTERIGTLVAYNVPVLIEFYCDDNGRMKNTTYTCPQGCENGACRQVICFDSDDGKNTERAGYTEGDYDGRYGKWYDTCVKEDYVREYYCEDNVVKSDTFRCEYGCANGKCQPRPQTVQCEETDNGRDIYTAGAATGYIENEYGRYADRCLDGYTLIEYYCAAGAAGNVVSEQIVCPSQRCENGACLR